MLRTLCRDTLCSSRIGLERLVSEGEMRVGGLITAGVPGDIRTKRLKATEIVIGDAARV